MRGTCEEDFNSESTGLGPLSFCPTITTAHIIIILVLCVSIYNLQMRIPHVTFLWWMSDTGICILSEEFLDCSACTEYEQWKMVKGETQRI